MTRWLAVISSFCVACSAIEVDPKDQRLSTATGRLTLNGKPFTGVTASRGPDSVERRSYRDGIEHGEYLMLAGDGSKLEERNYVNGSKHGVHRSWHMGGKPMVIQEFDMGINVGEYLSYHANGKIADYKKFDAQGRILVAKLWRATGQIYSNQSFDPEVLPNGTGLPGSKLCNSVKTNGAREKL